jgi:hypothetical protein
LQQLKPGKKPHKNITWLFKAFLQIIYDCFYFRDTTKYGALVFITFNIKQLKNQSNYLFLLPWNKTVFMVNILDLTSTEIYFFPNIIYCFIPTKPSPSNDKYVPRQVLFDARYCSIKIDHFFSAYNVSLRFKY